MSSSPYSARNSARSLLETADTNRGVILIRSVINGFLCFFRHHSTPQLLILNDCNIDRAGEPEDLKKKCRIVKELDLAQNKLNNWNEVGAKAGALAAVSEWTSNKLRRVF